MKTAYELEVMKRDAEIDREAAKLVRRGMSPYTAIKEAARVIDERRKEANDEQRVSKIPS